MLIARLTGPDFKRYLMKNKLRLFIAFISFIGFSAQAQSDYLVGTSNVSIEPDSSMFSLALAGYGSPKEGRFSITWKYISQTSKLKTLTSLNDKLYATNDTGELLVGTRDGKGITWTKIGKADNLTSMSGLSGRLYATTNTNRLLVGKPGPKGVAWKKIGKARNITGLTSLNGKLYAATGGNELQASTISGKRVKWKSMGKTSDSLFSLASDSQSIYAINSRDTLWSGQPGRKNISWTEIGRNNAETFNIRIRHITVLNNRLYAVAEDGRLYIAEHSTKNNLSSRALAITHKNQTAVIVGVDIVTFSYSLVKEIKDAIYKKRGIPEAAILINGSHTHFGPVTQQWLTWEDFYHRPDDKYMNMVKEGIISSIELALDNLTPSDIYFGRGKTNIGYNRRGSSNPAKPYDNVLDVLKIKSENSNQQSILFLTGCHPVAFKKGPEAFTISANFPATARDVIEDKTGAGNAIFMQGCAGDIDPRSRDYVQTGNELAKDVLGVLQDSITKLQGEISYALDTISIPVKPWSIAKIRQFKNENSAKSGDLVADKNIRWADLMLKNYQENKIPESLPVYVQTINIGNWKLVGLSREAVTEYGSAIRKIWPDKLVSVAGYCNDISSYLPNTWHTKAKVYEGYDSFFWYGQPAVFPLNAFDTIIEKIKILNR